MRGPALVVTRAELFLDKDLDGFAAAVGGALRHQFLRQVGEVVGTARDLGRVKLAAQRGGLGPVFVGVAEDADGVQARLGEELLEFRDVL